MRYSQKANVNGEAVSEIVGVNIIRCLFEINERRPIDEVSAGLYLEAEHWVKMEFIAKAQDMLKIPSDMISLPFLDWV